MTTDTPSCHDVAQHGPSSSTPAPDYPQTVQGPQNGVQPGDRMRRGARVKVQHVETLDLSMVWNEYRLTCSVCGVSYTATSWREPLAFACDEARVHLRVWHSNLPIEAAA